MTPKAHAARPAAHRFDVEERQFIRAIDFAYKLSRTALEAHGAPRHPGQLWLPEVARFREVPRLAALRPTRPETLDCGGQAWRGGMRTGYPAPA